MEIPILKEIIFIFALSIAVLLVCNRLKLPSVVGFLITGVICGPHGMGFVNAIDDVENLSTIGVILLLFTVGMEFSFKSIVKYKYYFFGGGALQIFGTVAAAFLISKFAFGRGWGEAIFLGFLLSLSSTAIVIRALDEKRESDTRHGRFILGILIFQDIVAIPMMLLIPLLAGQGEEIDAAHVYNFVTGLVLLVVVAVVAFRGVPKLLYYVTKTRQRELFLVSVFTICFAVAGITSSLGLSLSLGAFFAGLVISESEYSDEAVGNVLPFQEIFTSFFFVSMGMLLDLSFVIKNPLTILLITLGALGIKAFVAGGTAMILGLPLRSVVVAGIALSQIGEFALVLAHSGMDYELISDYNYQLFLSSALLTMTATPMLISLSENFALYLGTLPISQRVKSGMNTNHEDEEKKLNADHIIICGFGLRGKHLARAAGEAGIPYHILDTDPDTVIAGRNKGEPISFGDPSHHTVLINAGIKTARTVAVVVNNGAAARRIVKAARDLNPQVYIITRTPAFREVTRMFNLGADDVIPDEFGSSIEIFTRVLQKSDVSHQMISQCAHKTRVEGYEALRWHSIETNASAIDPKEALIETIRITNGAPIVGKSILTSELKKSYGLTVILIKRDNQTMTTIEADTIIQEADSLVVVGTPENFQRAKTLFQPI